MALKSSDLAVVLIFSSVPNQIGHDIPGIDHSLFTLQGYLSFKQASPKKMERSTSERLAKYHNITISGPHPVLNTQIVHVLGKVCS